MTRTTQSSSVSIAQRLHGTIQALLEPVVHYNGEKCGSLAAQIVADANRLEFKDLARAAEVTLQKIKEHETMFSEHQYVVNMYERSRWLALELSAALGQEYDKVALVQFRHDLISEPFDLCQFTLNEARKAGTRLIVGDFRKQVREAREFVDTIRSSLAECEENPEMFSHLRVRVQVYLNLSLLAVLESLQEAQKKTGLGLELTAQCDAMIKEVSLLGASRYARSSDRDYLRAYSRGMSEIASLLVAVESESRIAFAKAIGLTVSEETQRAISIREIPHADSEEMILALQSGMNDWIIDESNRSPQFGFSRAHTRDELHFYLSDCKARVFQLELDSQTVGYYLLFVDSTRFPPEIDQFFQELHAAGEFLEVAKAWVHLVMLTRAGRDLGRERGIDLYSALHEAVVDSLSAFQVEKAFAVVREGEIANKAKKSHLQRGWRETGVYKAFGKFDYQLIRLDLCPGGNWQY